MTTPNNLPNTDPYAGLQGAHLTEYFDARNQAIVESVEAGVDTMNPALETMMAVNQHLGGLVINAMASKGELSFDQALDALDAHRKVIDNPRMRDHLPRELRTSNGRAALQNEIRRVLGSDTQHFADSLMIDLSAAAAETAPQPETATPATTTTTAEQAQNAERQKLISDMLHFSGPEGTGIAGTYNGSFTTLHSGERISAIAGGNQNPVNTLWGRVGTAAAANVFRESGSLKDVLVEAVALTPNTKTTYTETAPAKTRFGKVIRPARRSSETTDVMTTGPDGKQERSITVGYQFKPTWQGDAGHNALAAAGAAEYLALGDSRGGNHISYVVDVPESVALRFRDAYAADPNIARDFGDQLIQKYVPEDHKQGWNEEKDRSQQPGAVAETHRYYPTYNSLPSDVQGHIFDLTDAPAEDRQPSSYRHTAVPIHPQHPISR